MQLEISEAILPKPQLMRSVELTYPPVGQPIEIIEVTQQPMTLGTQSTLQTMLESTLPPLNTTVPISPPSPVLTGLSKYELIEKVGQGGFGTVWKAYDKQKGQIIALKVVNMYTSEQTEAALKELVSGKIND